MKHLELHILQSVPVGCLNRDDLNSPKTAIFGGAQRARVSSQCWKRAIRDLAKEMLPSSFKGERTRYIIEPLTEALNKLGKTEDEAKELGRKIGAALATSDTEAKVKTLFYTTHAEIEEFAKLYIDLPNEKARKKAIEDLIGKTPKDAADIALFGRMVASDFTSKLEAAAMFSHALSTHRVDNELDFFAAIDDLQPKEDAGAGMTGTLEFNSATYYRFAAVNLDMLKNIEHLQEMTVDERKNVMKTFIKSTLMAMPVARKYSMNANTLPGYVIGLVRKEGHPIQLVNAFEKPIRAGGGKGLFELSKDALDIEYQTLKTRWKLDETIKVSFPEDKTRDGSEIDIDSFAEMLVAYVD